jgi:hypothetical protein
MYAEGADYVLMPRLIAAQQLLEITERMRRGDTTAMAQLKQVHIEHGQVRDEIVC